MRKFAYILAVALFAACSGGGSDEAAPATSNTEVTVAEKPTTTTVEVTTTTESPESQLLNRMETLRMLSDEACLEVDHYRYLGLEDPRVNDNGAEFHYDCGSNYWGWYHGPYNDHQWSEAEIDQELVSKDYEGSWLPIESIGAPGHLRHPKYPEAVILNELQRGNYCVRELVPDADGKTTRDIKIQDIGVKARFHSDTGELSAYAAVILEVDVDMPVIPNSLTDWGVLPYTFGYWQDAYVTSGICE